MGVFAGMFEPQEVEVQGEVARGLEGVREAFQQHFHRGEELSAQVDTGWLMLAVITFTLVLIVIFDEIRKWALGSPLRVAN